MSISGICETSAFVHIVGLILYVIMNFQTIEFTNSERTYMVLVLYKKQGSFYPTALKGCQGTVFTHDVQMGGWVAGKICLGCISETVKCRKLILCRDIG